MNEIITDLRNEFNQLLNDYKILYKSVRLDYNLRQSNENISKVRDKENEIENIFIKLLNSILSHIQKQTPDNIGNIITSITNRKHEYNTTYKKTKHISSNLLASESRLETIKSRFVREKIFFFIFIVYLILFFFFVYKHIQQINLSTYSNG